MINFSDTDNNIAFQDRLAYPEIGFAVEYSPDNYPLDFQYISSEAVSSFVAKRIDNMGRVTDTITLTTSLVTLTDGYHICTGLEEFADPLSFGFYYFLVNGHYQSDNFKVICLRNTDCLDIEIGGVLELAGGGCCLELES